MVLVHPQKWQKTNTITSKTIKIIQRNLLNLFANVFLKIAADFLALFEYAIKKMLPPFFYRRQPPLPYRLVRDRCSAHVTAALTAAPKAASTAVSSMSCIPRWAIILSRVPPPVPMPSWALVVFIDSSSLLS